MVEAITFSSEEERSAYRTMLLIRRFEEKAGQLYALGAIAGSSPLSIGQEALITGVAMAADARDPMVAAHRAHGIMLARRVAPVAIMAELMGRSSGVVGGLGGSLHMIDPQHGFFGSSVTPGQGAGIAAGLALAAKLDGSGRVAIAFLGDGAARRGRVYEAYAHAARLKLPVVFVIDNNTATAEGQDDSEAGAAPPAEAGRLYGIPGIQVDGIDVRKVRAQAQKALARAREGAGPTILEMMTYRYRGHGGALARPGQTEKRRDEADPIAKARVRMIETGIASEAELKAIEKDVRELVASAAQAAKAAPLAHVALSSLGAAP